MGSIFSFLNRREGRSPQPAGALPPTEPLAAHPAGAAAFAHAAAATGTDSGLIHSLDEVPGRLVDILSGYLPDPISTDVPANNIVLTSFTSLPLAVGNLRGIAPRGPFATVELKGGRLDATARFQVWAEQASQANSILTALQGHLLAARKDLWGSRILRMSLLEAAPAVLDSASDAWNARADYRVLFEYYLADLDGAQSLITRIPVSLDPEESGSLMRETMIITGSVVRWDNETAQVLSLRGPLRLRGLSVLDFMPGDLPTTGVTLLRSHTGAGGPPVDVIDLPAFLSASAVQHSHVRLRLNSLSDFLNLFTDTGETISMGNWDEGTGDTQPDEYHVRLNTFPSPLNLPIYRDTFQIALTGEALDRSGIVYLSADRI